MALTDFDLVLFGGGGDLAMRKLLPALYNRERAKDLPSSARIICVGRHEWNREEFLGEMNRSARPHTASGSPDPAVWDAFCNRIDYVALDATNPECYKLLVNAMRELRPGIRVLYMSGYAQPVLASQGTLDPGVTLVEKPFSETSLLDRIRTVLDPA